MFEKRAEYKLIDAARLNVPAFMMNAINNSESFIKDQKQLVPVQGALSQTIQKIAAADKKSSEEKSGDGEESPKFDLQAEIESHPDSLFIKCFAIKADETNDNGDFFSRDELVKATPTFVGVPLFTNHANADINEARGKVVHSWWDDEQNGIMIVGRVDAEAYPQLARGIKEEYVVGTSMGASRGHDLVTLGDGSKKRVDQMQIGDDIITHSGQTEKITVICETKKHKELYHIVWSGNKKGLALSYEHPVLVLRKSDVYTQPNKQGKIYRKNIKEINKTVKPVFVPASELKSGDYVLEIIDHKITYNSITEEDAFLLGTYAAEGYVNPKRTMVEFCCGIEDPNIPRLKSILERKFRIKETIIKERSGHYIKVKDKNFANMCLTLIGTGSKNKKLNNKVIEWRPKLQKAFLGAYIDGDGCKIKERKDKNNHSTGKGSLQASSASLSLLEGMRSLSLRLGIPARINSVDRVASKSTVMNPNTKYTEHSIIWGSCISSILNNYSNKALTQQKTERPKFDSFFYDNKYIAHRIKEIKKIPNSESTYYMQVGMLKDKNSDHSYILNNIATHNCFTPNCRVLMADGTYLPISEVQVGDKVYTHKGRTKEVLNTQIRYKDEFIKQISFEGYSSVLEVTKNHPILTLKTQETCACGCGENLPEYKKGSHRSNNWKTKYQKRFVNGHSQKIWNSNPNAKTHNNNNKESMQSSRTFDSKDLVWEKTQDLMEGDVVLLPCPIKEEKTRDCSVAKARLIGYFAAEGCFSRRKGKLYSVTFSFGLHEKDTYVKEVYQLIKKAFRGSRPCINPRKKGNVCFVTVRNPKIARWFYKYCGEYSHKKKFHSSILDWPAEYVKHLLGAYINGDGCFSTRRADKRTGSIMQSSDMATVSPDLASQLHLLFTKIGVYSRCYAKTGEEFTGIKQVVNGNRVSVPRQILGKQVIFNVLPSHWLSISGSFIPKLQPYMECPGLLHKRNNNKLRFVYTKSSNTDNDVYTNSPGGNYLVRKIKKIDNLFYKGPVLNLQVVDDNSYIVEDVAVKNCQVQYSLCSICHNYAETPDQYCSCIRERKTRMVQAKNQICKYHERGDESECPICGSKKEQEKKYAVSSKVFEYNYGIKFIENSFVVNPACSNCGVTEIIDPTIFRTKVAAIEKILPRLLKAAGEQPLTCTDKECIKIGGQQELDSLNQALDMLSSVSQSMLNQKEQIDLEFLSDLVQVLAELQTVTDELTEQGYGRLQSPGQPPTPGENPEGIQQGAPEVTNAAEPVKPTPGGGSKVHSGPAGQVGNVTSPLANIKILNLEKLSKNILSKNNSLCIPNLIIIPKEESTSKPVDGQKGNTTLKVAFSLPQETSLN